MRITRKNLRKLILESISDTLDLKEVANFIYRSNEIEGYIDDPKEIFSALEGVVQGYPASYVTRSPNIKAQILGIQATTTFKDRKGATLAEALEVHRAMGADVLDSGVPGMLRDNDARSAGGTIYVSPEFVAEAMSWWESSDFKDPFERHAVYELIHPFSDGNGRSGRILLLSNMNYEYVDVNGIMDYSYVDVNAMIGEDYFDRLDVFNEKYQNYFAERGWL